MTIDRSYFGCRELKTFLYDYVERELDPKALIALDNHIMVCEACEKHTQSYLKTIATGKTHIPRDAYISEEEKTSLVDMLTNDGQPS